VSPFGEGRGLPGPKDAASTSGYFAAASFGQQRLWMVDQLLSDKSAYNDPRAVRLTGPLDVRALEAALCEIVRRHDVLRTSFALVDGELRQVVAPASAQVLQVEDLSGLAANEREACARRLAKAEAALPFDLARGPLIRIRVLRLAVEEHWLLVTQHHVITDRWSAAVFARELSRLYVAFSRGEDSPLRELPVQYADYADWQRELLAGEKLEGLLSYWATALAELPVLDLPTDRPRPPVASFEGERVEFKIAQELAQGLKALGHRQKATLFMTLLAAFHVLLHRLTGQEDIAVGVPIAGRNRLELEELIGFFVNSLVLRGDLRGDPSFRAYLARVRSVALDAYAHAELPFEKLVERLAPSRDLSSNPLFRVAFQLANTPPIELELMGLVTQRVEGVSPETAKFDLMLAMNETADGLLARWEYSTDLFDAATIERMAGHFETLLGGIVADAEQCIGQLPLLNAAERRRLLVQWNDTAIDYPRDRCIHQLFEAQVARTPGAVAVVFEDEALTYAELNARANQLARHLIALGAGAETLVGICMERSLEMVVGLLGILKAGGAYVPLDPTYPQQRLAFMLEDTAAPILLTQQRLLVRLPQYQGRVVCLDRDARDIDAHGNADLDTATTVESLAYVIYTSGSTGRPKGVMIEHRSLVNYVHWLESSFPLAPTDRVLQSTSIGFDTSILEVFWPLFAGAPLELAQPEAQRSAEELIELARRKGITVLQVVPSMLGAIVEGRGIAGIGSLRRVFTAGEALGAELVRRFHSQSAAELVNGYGPTETTVYSTFFRCNAVHAAQPVPIGHPVSNTRIYVLDRHGEPVPIGVPGELCIGGAGLARGYLNRPELTAEKFVPDPFAARPGARMYRTGDLARYRADGNIEFLGRIDHQVKIRGFRIELGEIEAVLAEHAAVRQAVVLAREDTPGDKRLAAYIVPADAAVPDAESLRATLRKRLPDYMLPAAYVVLEKLPLLPNGKVDRRALPAPKRESEGRDGTFVAPRDPLEGLVAGVWREVLKLERVGVHDDFFEMGGHSLLAAQVVARLAKLLTVELPLRHFFERPTVAAQAAELREMLDTGPSSDPGSIIPVARSGDLPLSFAQQRLWILDRLLPDKAVYNIPSLWRLHGKLDVEALRGSIQTLVERHETLRTRFVLNAEGPMQVVGPAHPVTLPITDLGALPQAERALRARELFEKEADRAFDLKAGPVLRTQLLRIERDEHWLLFNVHHIASDGWSLGVLWRELSSAYNAFANRRTPELPALPIQYADYAVWQREWLQGDVLAGQLAYWKEQLAGVPALELPTDRPRPSASANPGTRYIKTVPGSLSQALRELGRREGATLFMTLLAAFQVLLYRCSGQEDIAVGSPIAGRRRTELEGLIGFFVNTLVLRTDLTGNPTFTELLARVRESALGAYTHQDLPFEKLVEEFSPSRDLRRNPLFDVMFVLQNAPEAALALEGIQASRLRPLTRHAKFDLTLAVSEAEDGLRTSWEYRIDLFDAATIERMAGRFETLLEDIVADAQQRIGSAPETATT